MSGLVFNAEGHTYTYDDKPIPSVTTILKTVGVSPSYYAGNGLARDRGSRIHEATEMMDSLELVPECFDEDIRPYLRQWSYFINSMQVKILRAEFPVYSLNHWYCGTLDRIVSLNGIQPILDIKTGAKAKWHPIQIAAYALALEEMEGITIDSGIILRLEPKRFVMDSWSDKQFHMEPFAPFKSRWLEILSKYKDMTK